MRNVGGARELQLADNEFDEQARQGKCPR